MENGQGRPGSSLDTALLLAVLLGALLALQLHALPASGVWMVLLGAVGAACWRWPHRVSRMGLGVMFGAALCGIHGRQALDLRLPETLSHAYASVDLRIDDFPELNGALLRASGRVEVVREGSPWLAGRRLRIVWYGQPDAGIAPGSLWRLRVRLARPGGPRNPGMADASVLALRERISATATVDPSVTALRIEAAGGWSAWRGRLVDGLADRSSRATGRFVRALVVGDTRGLVADDWEVLRRSGLTHLIAISGFHVTLAAVFWVALAHACYAVFPGLGRYIPRPHALALVALGGAIAYAALVGFALPAVRTVLMLAVVVVARVSRRGVAAGQPVALAAVIMLVMDPLCLLDPGYWLSLVGVMALVWWVEAEHGALLRTLWRTQWVATCALTPVLAVFFGEISVLGLVTNLAAVPLFSFTLVPLGLVGLGLHLLGFPGWAEGPWQTLETAFALVWPSLQLLAASPWAVWPVAAASVPSVLLAALGVGLILLPLAWQWRLAGVIFLWPLLAPPPPLPKGVARLTLWDVAMGQAMLLETHGHQWWLDVGRQPASGRGLVVERTRRHGSPPLAGVVVAHLGPDHAGALPSLRAAFPDAAIWAPPGSGLQGARPCRPGRLWEADGARLTILHPPPLFPYLRGESSCVLLLAVGGRRVLLPGDIGPIIQSRLAREQPQALRADVLVAPDHGVGAISTSFLDAVSPGWVLRSNARQRRSGEPVKAAIRDAGATLLETATAGALVLTIGADGQLAIETEAGRRWRWWQRADG